MKTLACSPLAGRERGEGGKEAFELWIVDWVWCMVQ